MTDVVWLTEHQVSAHTQIPVNTLRYWRQKRINIPFSKPGGTLVRYDLAAVDKYLQDKTQKVEVAS